MRICPDCGRELGDDEQLCPLCGAQLPENTQPPAAEEENVLPEGAFTVEPEAESGEFAGENTQSAQTPGDEGSPTRPKGKLLFAGIGVGAVAVVILAVCLISGLLKSPRDQFLLQHKKLLQTMVDNEFAFVAGKAEPGKGYSLDLTVTAAVEGTSEDVQAVNSLLRDGAIHLKMDSRETAAAMDGDITVGGKPFLSGSLRYDSEAGTLGFQFPELSELYYVADYVQLIKNLTGQEVTADSLVTTEENQAAYKRIVKTYGDILIGAVKRGNVTKQSGKYSVFVIRSDWQATAYVFKPTARDLEEMFLDLADALEADQDLPRLVNGFDEDTRAELVSGLRENAGEMAQNLVDKEFTWTIRTNGRGNYQVEISWRDGDNNAWIRFERSPDSLYFGWVGVDASSRDEVAEIWLTHYGDDIAGYHGDFHVTDMMTVEFENVYPEKTSSLYMPYGTYKFSPGEDILMTLNVAAAENGGTDHLLRMDFAAAGQDNGMTALEIDFYTTDQPVTLPEPAGEREDITDYTEEEFAELGNELAQGLYSKVLSLVLTRGATSGL